MNDKPAILFLKNFRAVHPDFTVEVPEFSLNAGERVAIVGSNGSGKTTLLEGILGLKPRTEGWVSWKGEAGPPGLSMKKDLGVQLQSAGYGDQMLVEEILYLHRIVYRTQEKSIMDLFEMKSITSKKYSNLSRGQKQRVDLFVAFGHAPKHIFLDEPITGLDSSFSRKFMNLFREFAEGSETTIFFACHSPEEFSVADSVLWLENGNVRDYGRKSSVLGNYLGEYKLELINVSPELMDQSLMSAKNELGHDVHNIYCVDNTMTMYGSQMFREWALRFAGEHHLASYSITSVTERDFLSYITREGMVADDQCLVKNNTHAV